MKDGAKMTTYEIRPGTFAPCELFAVDERGEDQADTDTGADSREAVAEDRDVAFHERSSFIC